MSGGSQACAAVLPSAWAYPPGPLVVWRSIHSGGGPGGQEDPGTTGTME